MGSIPSGITMKVKDAEPGQHYIECSGCRRRCDASSLILFGLHDGHTMYCTDCLSCSIDKPDGWFQWIKMMLGLTFRTRTKKHDDA